MKKIYIAKFSVPDLGIDRIVSSGKSQYEFRNKISNEVLEERNRFNTLMSLGFRCEHEDILHIQSKQENTNVIFRADHQYVCQILNFDGKFDNDKKNLESVNSPQFCELAIRTKNITPRALEKFCKPHLLNLDIDIMQQNLSTTQTVKRKVHKGHSLFQTYALFRMGVFSTHYNLYSTITDTPEEILKLEQKLYMRKPYFDTLEIRLESRI